MMAKDKAKAKSKEKGAPAKKEAETFKYGVADIAKKLGIKEASARVQLRNHKVKKAGKSYGWNTKDELDAVIEKIKPSKDEKPNGKKSKKDDDE